MALASGKRSQVLQGRVLGPAETLKDGKMGITSWPADSNASVFSQARLLLHTRSDPVIHVMVTALPLNPMPGLCAAAPQEGRSSSGLAGGSVMVWGT